MLTSDLPRLGFSWLSERRLHSNRIYLLELVRLQQQQMYFIMSSKLKQRILAWQQLSFGWLTRVTPAKHGDSLSSSYSRQPV